MSSSIDEGALAPIDWMRAKTGFINEVTNAHRTVAGKFPGVELFVGCDPFSAGQV
jgi:hypothetical protein